MACLQLELNVNDLAASVRFYTQALGTAPRQVTADRAEWALAEPCLRLAASTGRTIAPPAPMLREL